MGGITRKKTRHVKVGNVTIGGNAPVSVQSMCNTDTSDAKSTINQIHELEDAGCEIVRVAVPDEKSAKSLREIKENITIPLVADIHFDYRLALLSAGHVDKLRINPGNIGDSDKVKAVVNAAKDHSLPIRIGVNLGSLEKPLLKKYGPTPKAMVESALNEVRLLESLDFYDIVISLKASDVLTTIQAYELISQKVNYPLHLGVTEAGTIFSGTVKSSIGIGSLLAKGIGDTIRVSLTADPVEEVKAGFEILKSLGLRQGITIISCPTCARASIDVISLAKKVEDSTFDLRKPLKIAVMGCYVNGPGEAKHADIGVAGYNKQGFLFRKGKIIGKVPETKIVDTLLEEINKL
jgi:(E)-4-hydroxy-3-methylbut-2-enyl-diphosphate synthase